MGLYTTFNTSDYYDEPVKPRQPQKTVQQLQDAIPKVKPIPEAQRKSLYDQAKQILSSKSQQGPNFFDIYRVGQAVAIQDPKGHYRTKKGIIAEIVAETLMYVYMEDSYKDVTGQWLADFVTSEDKIIPL